MTATATPVAVSPRATLAVADHDLVARIARVWVLQQRPVSSRRELARLVDELQSWHTRTRDLLVRRFGDRALADEFDLAVGPLIEPTEKGSLADQVESVRAQAALRLSWLADLRGELSDRMPPGEPVPNGRAYAAPPAAVADAPVVVLCSTLQSPTGGAVAAALEALGDGQSSVVELGQDLSTIEHQVPEGAAAVVVVEREPRTHEPSALSLLALGWATGALGRDRVLAVLAPLCDRHPALGGCTIVPAKIKPRWRAEVVAWAAAASRP